MGDFSQPLKDTIARILKAAQAAGKWSGIYCPDGEFAKRYSDMGFRMVCVTNDMTAIPVYLAESLAKATRSAPGAVKGAADRAGK
ncbi:uncharacterized protein Z520_07026 [Fonsecaea multimorphosa CBS 102226]|uniref:HpcH/HpaI aldolase/citrate lyase domain-containing protein n=1 Tax=Fonsecaea multimorphosa CBS 102226 TaxID=1442371 RepID=A0A0D2KLL4_9EURO|nr:uncharacterized protein Z520_07026 [Fonsecaea multimorphosa CBS 102226]KIX97573.1 hypothetical protein Z520_07026 [Fonsecaea multimorphosa CBS 102226]